jgi:predicted RNA binding protein YcfA (HicA-like mRNA interferase family)
MSRLPLLSARELIDILFRLGFVLKRQKGSHKFFQHTDGRTTVIPDHGKEKIDRGLLNKIIKQDLMMSIDEFLNF